MNIARELNRIAEPYLLDGISVELGATYDADVCPIIEEYLEALMNSEPVSCAVSYCDYAVYNRRIEGVMTITCVVDYVPFVFPIIYWRKNG